METLGRVGSTLCGAISSPLVQKMGSTILVGGIAGKCLNSLLVANGYHAKAAREALKMEDGKLIGLTYTAKLPTRWKPLLSATVSTTKYVNIDVPYGENGRPNTSTLFVLHENLELLRKTAGYGTSALYPENLELLRKTAGYGTRALYPLCDALQKGVVAVQQRKAEVREAIEQTLDQIESEDTKEAWKKHIFSAPDEITMFSRLEMVKDSTLKKVPTDDRSQALTDDQFQAWKSSLEPENIPLAGDLTVATLLASATTITEEGSTELDKAIAGLNEVSSSDFVQRAFRWHETRGRALQQVWGIFHVDSPYRRPAIATTAAVGLLLLNTFARSLSA